MFGFIGKAATAAAVGWMLAVGGPARADDFFGNELPEGAVHKLRELVRNDAHVKCIAFTSKGGYAILFDDSGFTARNIPDDAFARLQSMAENGDVLKWIAFTPNDGFVILANQSGFFARDLPPAALRRLKTASDLGANLMSMTFAGKNGWVLVTDGGVATDGIPVDLFRQIQRLSANGDIIKSVAFTPSGGWAVLVNRDGAWDLHIPDGAFAKIDALHSLGGCRFNCIAFPPTGDDAWVLIVD